MDRTPTGESGDYYKNKDGDGYVKISDLSAEEFQDYALYFAEDLDRFETYQLNVKYLNADGTEAADKSSAISNAVDTSVKNIIKDSKTSITLTANNYTKADYSGKNKGNVAVRAEFKSSVVVSPYNNGIEIVHSGAVHGTDHDDITTIPRFAMNTVSMGISRVSAKTQETAKASLEKIQKGLSYVTDRRSTYGAYQNRLEHTLRNNENKAENTTAAESRIRDTDMAEEISRFTKDGILQQAGQSILAQANQNRQGLLSLLS